jgi:rhamnose transport system substrate-binding protein
MKLKTVVASLAAGLALAAPASAEDIRVGLVVKALGIGFFDAAHSGALEAAAEVGDMEIIYTGPTSTTAEGQIEVINSLIAQNVDVIAVSANDTDALVPTLQRAIERGIDVISWDSAVAAEGRSVHLDPSSPQLIGGLLARLAHDALPDGVGQVAIMSATPTSTNQNVWIEEMRKALPQYPGVEIATVLYGDDLADKSYRETVSLLQSNPDVKVIVAPTSVGIVAAAQAVTDQGKIGEVVITGLGLPSEMAGHIHSGAAKNFAVWNPIDLGYSTAMIAYNIAKENVEPAPGAEVSMGRVGTLTLDDTLSGAMAEPFVYDKSNVDEFAKIF